MRGRHADRIWMGIGVAGAAVLLALSYFLLISPKYAEAEGLNEQKELTEIRAIALERRLAELQQQQAKLPEYRAQLRRDKAALPTGTGVSDFLRQLQDAGDRAGTRVSNVTVGAPTPAEGVPGVHALPITLTAEGTEGQLGPFLDQLQQVQPRAVLVQTANLAAANSDSKNGMNLTVTLKVFVDTGPGATTPTAAVTN